MCMDFVLHMRFTLGHVYNKFYYDEHPLTANIFFCIYLLVESWIHYV